MVFDYDGVIVDSSELFTDFFLKGCLRIGRDDLASKEVFLSLFDGNMYETMLKKGLSKEEMVKVIFTLREGLLKHQEDLKIFSGVSESIGLLHEANVPLFVVTSNESAVVSSFLKKNGIVGFKDVIGSDRQPSKIKVLSELKKQFGNSTIWYVGDTCGDVREGRAAGVKTAVVTWGFHDEKRLKSADPDMVISSSEQLQNLFLN